jgi:hypothetical protein
VNTYKYFEKVENSEKSSEALKIQNGQFEKEKVSGFDQPLFKVNLTADGIWLADPLCCAIGLQQQADNFACTSIFLSAFTMDGASYNFYYSAF